MKFSKLTETSNRYACLSDSGDEESWSCEICKNVFNDPEAKMLECKRCKQHYCIACLKQSEEMYKLIAQEEDFMWFCTNCREKVEKTIETDFEIETKCNEIMKKHEDRLSKLEEEMPTKCSEDRVREIFKEEQKKDQSSGALQTGDRIINNEPQVVVNTVLNEIDDRKARENNMVIYGMEEIHSQNREVRLNHDKEMVESILDTCEVRDKTVVKIIRLGKFDEEKKRRPVLVNFGSLEQKLQIFRQASKLKNAGPKLSSIKVSNDLTKSERENEKKLFLQAKQLEEKSLGESRFRVRGPPWARKVVKLSKGN